jgi:hypothetical protein
MGWGRHPPGFQGGAVLARAVLNPTLEVLGSEPRSLYHTDGRENPAASTRHRRYAKKKEVDRSDGQYQSCGPTQTDFDQTVRFT